MSTRDELAETIHAEICEESLKDCLDPDWRGKCARSADVLIAAGWSKPYTVTSEAELDALPVNSVVVDTSDTPRTKRYGDSHMGAGWTNAGRSPLRSYELVDGHLMRVVFTPEARS